MTKIPGCVSVTPPLPSADAAGPVPDQLPHRALKQDRALVWHMCNKMWKQRRFGSRENRSGMLRKLPERMGQKLATGGRGSHLKKCSKCKQSSQLSAPEIIEIGLQWEKVGLYWELNHHSQPVWEWKQPSRRCVNRRPAEGITPGSSESLKPGLSVWL